MVLATKPLATKVRMGLAVSPDDYPQIAIAPLMPTPEWGVSIGSGGRLDTLRIR